MSIDNPEIFKFLTCVSSSYYDRAQNIVYLSYCTLKNCLQVMMAWKKGTLKSIITVTHVANYNSRHNSFCIDINILNLFIIVAVL